MEKAVVYARYSSHSQTDQSIEGQISAAKDYAERKGYTIINEYCDKAKTGTNDNREAFQKMLKDSSKREFSVIIVWKVDRFGRNREEIAINKYKVRKNGVRVEYVAENISEGPEGVILESVLEGMAEYYSLQLSQNIKRGFLESAKKHYSVGSLPLGYYSDNHQILINEEEAKAIKIIFNMYAVGKSKTEIINRLNEKNLKTKKHKSFCINSLTKILHNPIYYGVYKYKDIIFEEDIVPPIITKELFQKVQQQLKVNQVNGKNWIWQEYQLKSKVVCGCCGSKMFGETGTSKTGSKYLYYICKKRKQQKECGARRISAPKLDFLVINTLYELLYSEENINFLTELILKNLPDSTSEIKELEYQLKESRTSLLNLTTSIERGLDYDLVKERINELSAIAKDIEDQIEQLKDKQSIQISKKQIKEFLSKILKQEIKSEKIDSIIIRIFINSVIVNEQNIIIAMNYGADQQKIEVPRVRVENLKWSYVINIRTTIYKNCILLDIPTNF